MKAQINCIIAGQVVGKTGNGSITLFDLDTRQTVKITWQGGQLDPAYCTDNLPRTLILDGLELRQSRDFGAYLTCKNVADGSPAPKQRSA